MRTPFLSLAVVTLALMAGCQSNQKNEAKAQWNQARANVLTSLARDQYKAGNFDNCAKTLKDAIALSPRNAPLRILSARLAIERGQLELAESELKLAREFNPKDAEADYLSGVVNQRWSNPEVALSYYDAALTKGPGELSYLLAKAETLVTMGRAEDALVSLKDRVVFFEHSAAIRDAIGQLMLQKGDTNAAVDMLRQASILSTDDLNIREHLALALYQAGRHREAGDMIAKLVTEEPFASRGDLWLALGEARLLDNDNRAARESFEVAARLQPASPQVFLSMGKVSLRTGDYKRAELALRKSMSLDESSSEANLLLGYLRMKQERHEEALHAFRRANLLDPTDTTSQCMMGLALKKLGRPDEAVQYYGRVLRENPKDPLASKLMTSLDQVE